MSNKIKDLKSIVIYLFNKIQLSNKMNKLLTYATTYESQNFVLSKRSQEH